MYILKSCSLQADSQSLIPHKRLDGCKFGSGLNECLGEIFEILGELRIGDIIKLKFPTAFAVVKVRKLVAKIAQCAVSAAQCGI